MVEVRPANVGGNVVSMLDNIANYDPSAGHQLKAPSIVRASSSEHLQTVYGIFVEQCIQASAFDAPLLSHNRFSL